MIATIMNLKFADFERIAFTIKGYINNDTDGTSFSCNVFYDENYIDHKSITQGKIEDICFEDIEYPYDEKTKIAIKKALYDKFLELEEKYSIAFTKANGIRSSLYPSRLEKNKGMIIAYINDNYDIKRIVLPCRVLNDALDSNEENKFFIYNVFQERQTLKMEIMGCINKSLKEPDYYHEEEDWKNGLIMAEEIIGELL